MGWHAKYDVEDIVKSAWDAWRPTPNTTSTSTPGSRLTEIDGHFAVDAAKRFLVHKGVAGVPVAPFVVLWMFVTDVFACW